MAVRKQDISRKSRTRRPTMAELADPHELYEAAVQNVEAECDFVRNTFREITGRTAYSFREDFCGTASLACQWVRQGADFRAFGVDIDPSVLEWGREHRLSSLSDEQRRRVTLIQSDVMDAQTEAVDVIGAFNFSYWIFKKRTRLREYFTTAYRALKPGGLFFVDAYGGYEAFEELKEKTKCDGFRYIWHQAKYYPVTGDLECHIHFTFPDGSKLKRAFSYDWRLWTLPEIREVMEEAGFRNATVYWEGTDEDGDGNGEFSRETRGEADAGWIAYIVAEK